jgi:hypothetical protein
MKLLFYLILNPDISEVGGHFLVEMVALCCTSSAAVALFWGGYETPAWAFLGALVFVLISVVWRAHRAKYGVGG